MHKRHAIDRPSLDFFTNPSIDSGPGPGSGAMEIKKILGNTGVKGLSLQLCFGHVTRLIIPIERGPNRKAEH